MCLEQISFEEDRLSLFDVCADHANTLYGRTAPSRGQLTQLQRANLTNVVTPNATGNLAPYSVTKPALCPISVVH